jgi:predicted ABC-type transport system involved in lysophospholipase L1 biosynthesis ATPase subunit
MESDKNILSASSVSREFQTAEGTLKVLKDITLEVKKGQIATVTGASGVGKSTLLHILGGLDRPTRGEVKVSGEPLRGLSEAALARFRNRKVGFVFQFHYLLDDFTALENVAIPVLLAGESHAEARRRGELLLDQVGLIDRKTHRPKELSGGEQQRVAVARALANDPEIVLADEPSGNLDTATGRKLHELLFELNRRNGTSFLIATHNRELADKCEREFKLIDGRLAAA